MSQPCAIIKCKRPSRAVCDCCQSYLCLQHLSEHNAVLISELNPLVDEINNLNDRFKILNNENIFEKYREKLQQWRLDCYKNIDQLFEQKCQELHRRLTEKIEKQREDIDRMLSKVTEFIHQQEATQKDIDLLTETIHYLQVDMKNLEQNCFEIHISPLIIDENLIRIEEINDYEFDPFTFSPVQKTINYVSESWYSLASSDQFLLIHQSPNLCLLNRQLSIVRQTLWPHHVIWNMCWSSALNQFIIVEENNIFLVNPNTMSIENLETIEKQKWLSCTTSDQYLFLSSKQWGSEIVKYRLLPSVSLIQKWKSPDTCQRDEFIDDIVYNNGNVLLIITNQLKTTVRIELRSSETFDCIWILLLDILCKQNKTFCCCSLNNDEWLMTDYETRRLIHITKNGQQKSAITYSEIPYQVCRFASHRLAISTSIGVNLHKLS